MVRISKKEQQDKRELLSSLNQVNSSMESKHAAVNGMYRNEGIFHIFIWNFRNRKKYI